MSTAVITLANSALDVQRKKMELANSNIAVSDQEGNTAKHAKIEALSHEGKTLGIRISAIASNIDDDLKDQLFGKISEASYLSVISEFKGKIQDTFGTIGNRDSIGEALNEWVASLSVFSNTTSQENSRSESMLQLENMIKAIQQKANALQELRAASDQRLSEEFVKLNAQVENVAAVASGSTNLAEGTEERLYVETELNKLIQDISKYMKVKTTNDIRSGINIESSNLTLFDRSPRSLHYQPNTHIEDLINNEPFNEITMSNPDLGGKAYDFVVVKSNKSEQITHNFEQGSVSALIEVRDSIIPNAIKVLDNYVAQFSETMNAIHNKGSGYPPITKLEGTQYFRRESVFDFSSYNAVYKDGVDVGIRNSIGSGTIPPEYKEPGDRNEAQIHVLSADGRKLEIGGIEVPPIQIPFETLESEAGKPGQINTHTITQHVSNYNKKMRDLDRVVLTNTSGDTLLNDIKLVSKSNEFISGVGTNFEFDLELDTREDIAITSMNVFSVVDSLSNVVPNSNYEVYRKRDGAVYPTDTGVGTFGSTEYEKYYALESGNVRRTGANQNGPVVKFQNLASDQFPYQVTIAVTMKVPSDPAGTEYSTLLTFKVDDAASDDINGMINQYFEANNSTSTDYAVSPPLFGSVSGDILYSNLVEEGGAIIGVLDGTDIVQTPGAIEFFTANTDRRIAIDSMGSKHLGGKLDDRYSDGTDRGFSHFFGLNDILIRSDEVSRWDANDGISYYLDIRKEIKSDAANFAAAQLFDGELSVGNNDNLTEFQDLMETKVQFSGVGKFLGRSTSVLHYSNDMISFFSLDFQNAQKESKSIASVTEKIEARYQGAKGVNMDHEMAGLMMSQHLSAANIGVIRSGMRVLDEIIGLLRR